MRGPLSVSELRVLRVNDQVSLSLSLTSFFSFSSSLFWAIFSTVGSAAVFRCLVVRSVGERERELLRGRPRFVDGDLYSDFDRESLREAMSSRALSTIKVCCFVFDLPLALCSVDDSSFSFSVGVGAG